MSTPEEIAGWFDKLIIETSKKYFLGLLNHQIPPGGSMQLLAENEKFKISTVHFEINSTIISETGVFEKKEKETDYGEPGVVETYKTREEAVIGHFKWCDKYGVPRGNTKPVEK